MVLGKKGTICEIRVMTAKEMKTKMNQKEMLEIKNTATKMRNSFDVLISRLNMSEGEMSELENSSIKTSKTKLQRKKNEK